MEARQLDCCDEWKYGNIWTHLCQGQHFFLNEWLDAERLADLHSLDNNMLAFCCSVFGSCSEITYSIIIFSFDGQFTHLRNYFEGDFNHFYSQCTLNSCCYWKLLTLADHRLVFYTLLTHREIK